MAKIVTLADGHHVMRFVPYAKCEKDSDDNVIGFLPQAFEHRVQEGTLEEYLSAAWVEFFAGLDHQARCEKTVQAFESQPKPRVGAKARFAVGNCGDIRAASLDYGLRPRISHEPVKGFDSHASVRKFQKAPVDLLALLAADQWSEMYLPANAKAVPVKR